MQIQIGDFVSDGAEKIKETAEDVWGNVTDPNSGPRKFVDDLWDKVSGFFGKAANKTAEAVGDAAETVRLTASLSHISSCHHQRISLRILRHI